MVELTKKDQLQLDGLLVEGGLLRRLIEDFEGLPNGGKPYLCPEGHITIGYGNTRINGKEVTWSTPRVSHEQAVELYTDLIKYDKALTMKDRFPSFFEGKMNPDQQAVMMSYVFNMKETSIRPNIINYVAEAAETGNWDLAADNLKTYNNRGLLKERRDIEADILAGRYDIAIPAYLSYKQVDLTSYLAPEKSYSREELADILTSPERAEEKIELEKLVYEHKGFSPELRALQEALATNAQGERVKNGLTADGKKGPNTQTAWEVLVANGGVTDEIVTQIAQFQSTPHEDKADFRGGMLFAAALKNNPSQALPVPGPGYDRIVDKLVDNGFITETELAKLEGRDKYQESKPVPEMRMVAADAPLPSPEDFIIPETPGENLADIDMTSDDFGGKWDDSQIAVAATKAETPLKAEVVNTEALLAAAGNVGGTVTKYMSTITEDMDAFVGGLRNLVNAEPQKNIVDDPFADIPEKKPDAPDAAGNVGKIFAQFDGTQGKATYVYQRSQTLSAQDKAAAALVQVSYSLLDVEKFSVDELGHVAGGKTADATLKYNGVDKVVGEKTWEKLRADVSEELKQNPEKAPEFMKALDKVQENYMAGLVQESKNLASLNAPAEVGAKPIPEAGRDVSRG